MIQKIPIETIQINPRIRKETSDLSGLKKSILSAGLIQPIVLTGDYVLISGYRRLNACRELGWTHIPAIIHDDEINSVSLLDIEYYENIGRQDLTDEEKTFYFHERKRLLTPEKSQNRILLFFKRIINAFLNFIRKITGKERKAEN